MRLKSDSPRVAIACGGTGGHLFPGVAVAHQLRQRDCAVTLLISPKEIDQQAVRTAGDLEFAVLPAVGLTRGRPAQFAQGFAASLRQSWSRFRLATPDAVLAMDGFTSAPPVIAGRMFGAATFLHESNTIPGKANRWLSWLIDQAFVGFPEAADRLHTRRVRMTGTPVRPEFQTTDLSVNPEARGSRASARLALGLDPDRPTLLVTGGSQGARGLNDLVVALLPQLAQLVPRLQLFHLTGANDAEKITATCAAHQVKAVVRPFFGEMHLALGAADAVISRAGASSLAEIAAMRVPAILVPYPAATDNHQFYNARAFEMAGAARLFEANQADPGKVAASLAELMGTTPAAATMRDALAQWHFPRAAAVIADHLLAVVAARRGNRQGAASLPPRPLTNHQTAIL